MDEDIEAQNGEGHSLWELGPRFSLAGLQTPCFQSLLGTDSSGSFVEAARMSERVGGARWSGDWEARRSQAPRSSAELDSPCLIQCVCLELHSWVEC